LAIVQEEVDERGLTSYVVKLVDLGEEQRFGIMARGRYRSWSHKDIAILVENRHNLEKAAKLTGRTIEACKKKGQRLGFSMSLGGTSEKNQHTIVMVFPRKQIERRRAIIQQTLSPLKELLSKVERTKKLTPRNIKDLARIVRATASLLSALEKWETGEEMLEMWKVEEEEEDAD